MNFKTWHTIDIKDTLHIKRISYYRKKVRYVIYQTTDACISTNINTRVLLLLRKHYLYMLLRLQIIIQGRVHVKVYTMTSIFVEGYCVCIDITLKLVK